MQVSQQAAWKLIIAMKLPNQEKYQRLGKLESKLNRPEELERAAAGLKGSELELFRKISQAVSDGDKIELVDTPEEGKKTEQEVLLGKNKPPIIKKAPVGGEKSEGRDKWGSRLSSQAARINAVIGESPLTFKEVAEKTGIGVGRVREHVRFWVQDGRIPFVVDGDKVYLKIS